MPWGNRPVLREYIEAMRSTLAPWLAVLTLTAAGGVLRALIAKGLATKGQKRGTYLAKGAAGSKR